MPRREGSSPGLLQLEARDLAKRCSALHMAKEGGWFTKLDKQAQ